MPPTTASEHWTDLQYVQLAIALAIVTAIEVALSYMVDDLGAFFLPLLLMLMVVKFFAVVMYFMHLKFDNRLFSMLFYIGLVPRGRRVLGGAVHVQVLQPLTADVKGAAWRNRSATVDRPTSGSTRSPSNGIRRCGCWSAFLTARTSTWSG